ncbi:hypothetical protein ACRAWG_05835 [Methylobacterium sp. P31]
MMDKEPELTPEQAELMRDVLERGAQRVTTGYKPAIELRDLGRVNIEEDEGASGWIVTPKAAAQES